MSVGEIGKSATKGAMNIFIGKLISRAIGIVGGVILVRILGPDNYGLILIATTVPNILLLFGDFGMDTAATRFLSEAHTKDEKEQMRYTFFSGLIFKAIVSTSLSLVCFFGAEIFAAELLDKNAVTPLIQIAAALIFAWTMSNFLDASLLGFDLTEYYALIMIFLEILLSALPIILVLSFLAESFFALLGMVVATLITVFAELAVCFHFVSKHSDSSPNNSFKASMKKAFKKSFSYGAPIEIIVLLNAGLGQFYKFLVARFGTAFENGNYGVAQNGSGFVDYLAWPISLVIFPMFSKVNHTQESESLRKLFKYSVKYSTLVILPAATAVFVLGKPIITLLFGIEYEYAWNYLLILAISWLLYGLGAAHLRKLLLAQGETKFLTLMDALTAAVSIPMALAMVWFYGIIGLIVATILSPWPSYVLQYRKAQRKYGASLPLGDLARIYAATLITTSAALLASSFLAGDVEKLALGLIIILGVYTLSIVLTRAIKMEDIEILRRMSGKSSIRKFVRAILLLMERMIHGFNLE